MFSAASLARGPKPTFLAGIHIQTLGHEDAVKLPRLRGSANFASEQSK